MMIDNPLQNCSVLPHCISFLSLMQLQDQENFERNSLSAIHISASN